MRRTLLVFVAVFVAAALAAISFYFVPETSQAATLPPSEGGPSQGTFTQGATAGPNEPSLVDDTPPTAAELNEPLMGTESKADRRAMVRVAKRYIGTRYRWGTCTRSRMSCTCLTKKTWAKFGHRLPLTERGQWNYPPAYRVAKSDLRKGDIVFFKEGGRRRGITHVGIYSGHGNLVHASAFFGKVVESKMRYIRGFHGAKRVRPR
jgi:cell wall-associated NlpC family hydrolase